MARPSNLQIAGLSAAQGLLRGLGEGMEQDEAVQKQSQLQAALERRQEERDQRNAIPKSLYGPMWEKMTGLKIEEMPDAPDYLSPSLGSVLLQWPGKQLAADTSRANANTRNTQAGQRSEKDKAKMLADAYSRALAAGRRALPEAKYDAGYTSVVGPQRDAFNTAAANEWASVMRGLAMNEAAPTFLEAVPGTPQQGGFMGFGGTPAVPEGSKLAPYQYMNAATKAIDPVVLKTVQKARAGGMNDTDIAVNLSKRGFNLTPQEIAGIR